MTSEIQIWFSGREILTTFGIKNNFSGLFKNDIEVAQEVFRHN